VRFLAACFFSFPIQITCLYVFDSMVTMPAFLSGKEHATIPYCDSPMSAQRPPHSQSTIKSNTTKHNTLLFNELIQSIDFSHEFHRTKFHVIEGVPVG
jgi:hypothetical protein